MLARSMFGLIFLKYQLKSIEIIIIPCMLFMMIIDVGTICRIEIEIRTKYLQQ